MLPALPPGERGGTAWQLRTTSTPAALNDICFFLANSLNATFGNAGSPVSVHNSPPVSQTFSRANAPSDAQVFSMSPVTSRRSHGGLVIIILGSAGRLVLCLKSKSATSALQNSIRWSTPAVSAASIASEIAPGWTSLAYIFFDVPTAPTSYEWQTDWPYE